MFIPVCYASFFPTSTQTISAMSLADHKTDVKSRTPWVIPIALIPVSLTPAA
ncbi:MAG: hypothetical protein QXX11_05850 [Thermoplasmata archaeon]